MELFRADMALFRAEVSVGKREAVWTRWATITIGPLLAGTLVYGFSIVILALREGYVHKQFIKS
jgi:hypothetical protein